MLPTLLENDEIGVPGKATFVENLCRYFIADCGDVVVAVFDNVDRLGRHEQISD